MFLSKIFFKEKIEKKIEKNAKKKKWKKKCQNVSSWFLFFNILTSAQIN
jgi:hypothetical protein